MKIYSQIALFIIATQAGVAYGQTLLETSPEYRIYQGCDTTFLGAKALSRKDPLSLKCFRSDFVGNNIPKWIFRLKELEMLDLSSAKLNTTSSDLVELQELKFLNLRNNDINYVHSFVFELPHLKGIDLSHNKIKTLEFPERSGLEYVLISHNQLDLNALPDQLWSAQNLTHLDIGHNQLPSGIPDGLFTPGNYSFLGLAGLPISLEDIMKLQAIHREAIIQYYDTIVGGNIMLPPLTEQSRNEIASLIEGTKSGEPRSFYVLGKKCKEEKQFGLAIRSFERIFVDNDLRGTAAWFQCGQIIGDLTIDEGGELPDLSYYRNTKFRNIESFEDDFKKHRGVVAFTEILKAEIADSERRDICQSIKAAAALKFQELITIIQTELKNLFEQNQRDVLHTEEKITEIEIKINKLKAEEARQKARAKSGSAKSSNLGIILLYPIKADYALQKNRLISDNEKIEQWLLTLEKQKQMVARGDYATL